MIKAMKKFAGKLLYNVTYRYWIVRTAHCAMNEYNTMYGGSILDLTDEERNEVIDNEEFWKTIKNKSGWTRFLKWLDGWAS